MRVTGLRERDGGQSVPMRRAWGASPDGTQTEFLPPTRGVVLPGSKKFEADQQPARSSMRITVCAWQRAPVTLGAPGEQVADGHRLPPTAARRGDAASIERVCNGPQ
jgi:hypothetical protein